MHPNLQKKSKILIGMGAEFQSQSGFSGRGAKDDGTNLPVKSSNISGFIAFPTASTTHLGKIAHLNLQGIRLETSCGIEKTNLKERKL